MSIAEAFWLIIGLWRRRAITPQEAPKLIPPPPKAQELDDRFGYGFDLGAKPPPVGELAARDLIEKPKVKPLKGAGGEFYFKDDVLDQLEYYIEAVKRLKRHDYDTYSMISRLGANLIPDRLPLTVRAAMPSNAREGSELEPWFLQTLPAFGAVCYTTDKDSLEWEKTNDKTSPRIFYFNKYSLKGRPSVLQPVSLGARAVYIVGAVWDFVVKDTGKRSTGISEVALSVEADGSIRPLKGMTPRYIRFPSKNHRRNNQGVERLVWDWPEGFAKLAKRNEMTPEQSIINMFLGAASQHELFNASMIRVAVTKNGVTAQMNVNIERTPYFFKDRDVVVDERGVKKRIFHIVRPHVRENGAQVRLHFRGLRRFDWNGYRIGITVPGIDHGLITEAPFDSLAPDSELAKDLERDHERTISQPVMARKIAKYLEPPSP